MAEGIRKRHSKGCAARGGGRCNCNAGWEASIYLTREGRKLRRTFARESEAKSWRADARAAANARSLRMPSQVTVEQAAWLWLEAARSGAVRDRSGHQYKPGTWRIRPGARPACPPRVRRAPTFGVHSRRPAGLRGQDARSQARGEHHPQHHESAPGDLSSRRASGAGGRQPEYAKSIYRQHAGGARGSPRQPKRRGYRRPSRLRPTDLGDGLLRWTASGRATGASGFGHRPWPRQRSPSSAPGTSTRDRSPPSRRRVSAPCRSSAFSGTSSTRAPW